MSRNEPSAEQQPTGSALAALWPSNAPPDVRALLDRDPDLRGDRDAVLDLAYDEYCRLIEAGQAPDPDEFCARYPTFGSALRLAIEARAFFSANPSYLEEKKPVAWPGPGETFLGFRLLRELGRGAFARVFLAAEPDLGDRLVAVKVSPHGGTEAQTLGPLNHPNVVKVHAVRRDEGSGLTAVCMPYLGGATLFGVLSAFQDGRPRQASVILDAARATLSPDAAGDWPAPEPLLARGTYAEGVCLVGSQLADALAFLHARGIFHRDLKPSNVLLCPDGRPMLLDFNLSTDPRAARDWLGGTLPYMSPEQVTATFGLAPAAEPVDGRSDLFSLGVILFELLTGRQPFGEVPLGLPSAEDAAALLLHQAAGAPPVRRLCPEAPPALAGVIDRCLAFGREGRPRDAAEIATALRRDLAPHRRAVRRLRRHPWKFAAAALAVVLAVGGIGSLSYGRAEHNQLVEQPDLVDVQPPSPEQLLLEAKAAYAGGDDNRTIDLTGRVLAADPNSAEAHFLRGRAYQRQKQLTLALDEYYAAEDLGMKDGRAAACAAYCLSRKPDHKEAIVAGKRAIGQGFAVAEVYNNLAYSQIMHGQFDDAAESLRQPQVDQRSLGLAAANYNRLWLLKCDLVAKEPRSLWVIRDRVARAIEGAPPSVELYELAAEVCAFTAEVYAGDKAEAAALEADALTHLRSAVECGLRLPEKPTGEQTAKLYDRLLGAPCDDIRKAAQKPDPPRRLARRLIDPIADEARIP
jgi:serine/threonine protein kinase